MIENKLCILKIVGFFESHHQLANISKGLDLDSWKLYPGALKQVAVGPYGVWGVNKDSAVYQKTSSGWQHIGGELQDISVGRNSVWGTNKDDDIHMREGRGGWEQIQGKLRQVKEVL